MILVKIHRTGINEVISFCDANLINKKVQEGNSRMDITGRFYKGEAMPEKKMLTLMQTSRNPNIVGEGSIAFAMKHHIITKTAIISIQGIPHAQVMA